MDRDRPTTTRIVITIASIIAAVAVGVGALAFAVDAALGPDPVGAPVSSGSTVASSVASVEPSEPAATPAPPEPVETPKPAPAPAPEPEKPSKPAVSGVVCIDPGHQARADSSLEPVGPGASEKKPKVAGGASGRATGNPESLVNLQVSLKLREELEARGIRVVMVRETQDVNVSNSERAAVANEAGADLFIRLHCDGAGDSSRHGLSTLIPASNSWTGPIVGESRKAGDIVHAATIAATGARDLGVVTRSDLSGFNWAKVPTILVEMGFMSNAEEDRRLATDSYQSKLADGMADGIVEYLTK